MKSDKLEKRHRELLDTLNQIFLKWPELHLGRVIVGASPACNCPEVSNHHDDLLNKSLRETYLPDEGREFDVDKDIALMKEYLSPEKIKELKEKHCSEDEPDRLKPFLVDVGNGAIQFWVAACSSSHAKAIVGRSEIENYGYNDETLEYLEDMEVKELSIEELSSYVYTDGSGERYPMDWEFENYYELNASGIFACSEY